MHPQKTSKQTGGTSQFESVLRQPTESETKVLIGLMAGTAIEVVMANHFYTIGDNIRRQEEGGSIGSDLTGEAARLYMLQWDQQYLNMIKNMGLSLDMFARYVDDMIIVTRAVGQGWHWNKESKSLKWSQDQFDKDQDESPEERTARVLSMMANSINANIQTTTDLQGGTVMA